MAVTPYRLWFGSHDNAYCLLRKFRVAGVRDTAQLLFERPHKISNWSHAFGPIGSGNFVEARPDDNNDAGWQPSDGTGRREMYVHTARYRCPFWEP